MASPSKKQRTTFRSTLGEFSVVANAAKIAAICEERDEAVEKVAEMAGFLSNISTRVHGADGTHNGMPKWGSMWGYSVPMSSLYGYQDESDHCAALRWANEDCGWCYDDYPDAKLVRSTGAYEALTGGLFTTLPVDWDAAKLEEAKKIERLILGDEKAAIAENLTDVEKVEFRGVMKGLEFSLGMLGKVPFKETKEAEDFGYSLDGLVEGSLWVRKRAAACAGTLPPKFFKLVCTPDERPFMCYTYVRELYDYFGGNYERAKGEYFATRFACWDGTIKGAVLDDTNVPIAERIALVKTAKDKANAEVMARRAEWDRDLEERRRHARANPHLYKREEDHWQRQRRLGKDGREAIRGEASAAAHVAPRSQ
jgi:hypothetical protein